MEKDNRELPGSLQRNTKAKKVLICRNAYRWQYGGAEKFTLNLALGLRKNNIDCVISTRVPELMAQASNNRVKIFNNIWFKNETQRRWMLLYYLAYPILVLQYMNVIISNKIDAVILGSRDDQIFATIAAKILRKPIIWVDHADMKGIISQPFRFLRNSYFWSLKNADRIVAVSQSEKNLIFNNLPSNYKSKFRVINNGAVRIKSSPISRPNNSFVITFVGRLEKDKGVYELLDSAEAICKGRSDVYFWLVGKGSVLPNLSQVIESKKLSNRIVILGHLDSVFDALDSSDIFVYPSHHDASPLAPVEALLAGLPVIATRVGGIPEVIDESCGILIEKQNTVELISAINKLVTNRKLLRRLGNGARKKAHNYEFDVIVKNEYIPLLNEVLKNA